MDAPGGAGPADWTTAYEAARRWILEPADGPSPGALAPITGRGCALWVQRRGPLAPAARALPGRPPPGVTTARATALVQLLVEMVVSRPKGGSAS